MIKKIVLFLLFVTIAFNVTYWAMAKYEVENDYSANGDAEHYMQMGAGNLEGVPHRYSVRFLMPRMVQFVHESLAIESFLNRYYDGVGNKMMQLSYGLVNILFLSLSGYLLFFYCKALNFSDWESLTGSLLFFTSFFVITYYTTPLVDSAASFIVLACFYAILKRRLLWLFILFLCGVMIKETTFVVLLVILLDDRRDIIKRLLVCVPGVALYIFMTRGGDHSNGISIFDILTNLTLLKDSIQSGLNALNCYSLIETTQTFMFLWVLWLVGLFKGDIPVFLRRKSWLLVLPFIVPFLVRSAAVGRVSFYLFPVIIPISLCALKSLLVSSQEIEGYENT